MGFFTCCFKCLACFGCRDCIVNKFAFMPPVQNSYALDLPSAKYREEECDFPRRINFLDTKGNIRNIGQVEGLTYESYLIKTSAGHFIPCLYVQYTKKDPEYVIIFSHGNSTDIGRMFETYMDLAYNLKVLEFL